VNNEYKTQLERHFDWCRESILEGRKSLDLFETGKMTFHTNGVDTTEESKASLRRVIENLENHLKDHDEPLPD
jgi:hypothetical protein